MTKGPGKPVSMCDYCGVTLPPRHAATIFGLFACDPCLLEHCDDASDAFEAAARWKRGITVAVIEDLLARASDRVKHAQLTEVREQLSRARSLYNDGEFVAAMEAAQAAWNASATIHVTLELAPLARTGAKVRRPFADANDDASSYWAEKRAAWQARADAKWSEPQHSAKTASEIARLIAGPGENPNTIRRKIKKVVTSGGADN